VSVATTLYALRAPALAADRAGDLEPEEQRACYDRWVRAHTGRSGEAALRRLEAASETDKHGEALDVFRG
jgi:hypothetical protein